MSDLVLECNNVAKYYIDADKKLNVLSGLEFKVKSGDQVAIVGKSGSGKTTLLQLLAGLDSPSNGEVKFLGRKWSSVSETKKSSMRNSGIGFIYQLHHLLPEFTALENVAMPLLIRAQKVKDTLEQAEAMLIKVGLKDRLKHKPAELSGGERQRVAIARALVTKPSCVLADEPTGNLDLDTGRKIFDLFCEINAELNTTCIVVTHDLDFASKMKTSYKLSAGKMQQI